MFPFKIITQCKLMENVSFQDLNATPNWKSLYWTQLWSWKDKVVPVYNRGTHTTIDHIIVEFGGSTLYHCLSAVRSTSLSDTNNNDIMIDNSWIFYIWMSLNYENTRRNLSCLINKWELLVLIHKELAKKFSFQKLMNPMKTKWIAYHTEVLCI